MTNVSSTRSANAVDSPDEGLEQAQSRPNVVISVRSKSLYIPNPPTMTQHDLTRAFPGLRSRHRRTTLVGAGFCDASDTGRPPPLYLPGDRVSDASISPPTMWDEQLKVLDQGVPHSARKHSLVNNTMVTTTTTTTTTTKTTTPRSRVTEAEVAMLKPVAEFSPVRHANTTDTLLEISPPTASPPENTFFRRRQSLLEQQQQQQQQINKPKLRFHQSSQKGSHEALVQSPRGVVQYRGATWTSLLPGSGPSLIIKKEIEVPEDDPGGRRTSVLKGGTMPISKQMNLSLHHKKLGKTAAQDKMDEARELAGYRQEEMRSYLANDILQCRNSSLRPTEFPDSELEPWERHRGDVVQARGRVTAGVSAAARPRQ